MQGWAKGLKERVERTATQLSHASTAFTPPEDGVENGNDAADQQNDTHNAVPRPKSAQQQESSDNAGHAAGATAVPGIPSNEGMHRVCMFSLA